MSAQQEALDTLRSILHFLRKKNKCSVSFNCHLYGPLVGAFNGTLFLYLTWVLLFTLLQLIVFKPSSSCFYIFFSDSLVYALHLKPSLYSKYQIPHLALQSLISQRLYLTCTCSTCSVIVFWRLLWLQSPLYSHLLLIQNWGHNQSKFENSGLKSECVGLPTSLICQETFFLCNSCQNSREELIAIVILSPLGFTPLSDCCC